MRHALTFDIEDAGNLAYRQLLGIEREPTARVVELSRRVLEMLEGAGVRATFFVLGEVARTHPALVREIAGAGHELGIHGFSHLKVTDLTQDRFRDEVLRARAAVEDAAGVRVMAHRAPVFSIGPRTRWALEVLADLGFAYDSSVFPIAGRRYGWPGFRPDIHLMELGNGHRIIEAPLSTVKVLGRRLPVCGGGYVRHFPLALTLAAMRAVERERPVIAYFHPYELDQEREPDLALERLPLFRQIKVRSALWLQSRNRQTVKGKLKELLRSFRWAPLRDVIEAELAQAAIAREA